jgi:hypothetical protein
MRSQTLLDKVLMMTIEVTKDAITSYFASFKQAFESTGISPSARQEASINLVPLHKIVANICDF